MNHESSSKFKTCALGRGCWSRGDIGWTLGSTAERMAADRAESAVVSVLAPICVEKFQQQANSAAKLIEFKKAASWDQRALIEKGGWATTPGTEKMNSAVASACVDKLGRLS